MRWLAVVMVLLLGACGDNPRSPSNDYVVSVAELDYRVNRLVRQQEEIDSVFYSHVQPLYIDLMSTGRVRDHGTAFMTANYVNQFAEQFQVDPFLVTAIIKVENPWLVPDTTSFAGALGIMQVMPDIWSDGFVDCGIDLEQIRTNVCKGVGIISFYLRREISRSLNRALLRYNGCVNTEGCETYSLKVLRGLDDRT